MVNCFTKTYKQAGIKGLYAGYLLSVSGIVAYRGIYFGFFDTSKAFGKSNLCIYLF